MNTIHINLTLLVNNKTLDFQYKKIAAKMLDHLELSSLQSDSYSKYLSVVETFDNDVASFNNQMELIKNRIDEMERNLLNQLLTSLSIFTGLLFIVFGGIPIIGDLSVFLEKTINNFGAELDHLSVVGIILLGLIYTFF